MSRSSEEPGKRRRRRPRRDIAKMSDRAVLYVTRQFLDGGKAQTSAPEVARRYNERFGDNLTREQVFPVAREGIRRGFARFDPPYEEALAAKLESRLGQGASVPLDVHVIAASSARLVGATAAGLIDQLLGRAADVEIRLGLGPGPLVRETLRSLRTLLHAAAAPPNLTLHSLTPPGYVDRFPNESPIASGAHLDVGRNRVDWAPLAQCTGLDLAVCETWSLDGRLHEPGPFQLEQVKRLLGNKLGLVLLAGHQTEIDWLRPFVHLPGPHHLLIGRRAAEHVLGEAEG